MTALGPNLSLNLPAAIATAPSFTTIDSVACWTHPSLVCQYYGRYYLSLRNRPVLHEQSVLLSLGKKSIAVVLIEGDGPSGIGPCSDQYRFLCCGLKET